MGTINQDEEYEENLKAARKEIADTLEKALAMFPSQYEGQVRVALASYVMGYLGVSYGLKYG